MGGCACESPAKDGGFPPVAVHLGDSLAPHGADGILRIIDTEAHRDYNTAIYDAGKESGIQGLKKRWMTMMDGKVRDTHSYLQGMAVGLDDRFYTFDGDSALAPGGFELPENNVNCRCWITLGL